jgi:hypothetical protein
MTPAPHMATPPRNDDDTISVPPHILADLAALEDRIAAALHHTQRGGSVYQRRHQLAANVNRTGKRLLGELHMLLQDLKQNGNGGAHPPK